MVTILKSIHYSTKERFKGLFSTPEQLVLRHSFKELFSCIHDNFHVNVLTFTLDNPEEFGELPFRFLPNHIWDKFFMKSFQEKNMDSLNRIEGIKNYTPDTERYYEIHDMAHAYISYNDVIITPTHKYQNDILSSYVHHLHINGTGYDVLSSEQLEFMNMKLKKFPDVMRLDDADWLDILNGVLVGCVAATTCGNIIPVWTTPIIAYYAFYAYKLGHHLEHTMRIVDTVHAFPVHGMGSIIGSLAAGFYGGIDVEAREQRFCSYYGHVFYGDWWKQIFVQATVTLAALIGITLLMSIVYGFCYHFKILAEYDHQDVFDEWLKDSNTPTLCKWFFGSIDCFVSLFFSCGDDKKTTATQEAPVDSETSSEFPPPYAPQRGYKVGFFSWFGSQNSSPLNEHLLSAEEKEWEDGEEEQKQGGGGGGGLTSI